MTRYYETGAYRSAVAHPFHVQCYASWEEHDPTVTVGFQTEEEARSFAASRPEPIIDLARRDVGCIAQRRAIAHPRNPFSNVRDDFPAHV